MATTAPAETDIQSIAVMGEWLPGEANWCTVASWTSRPAGCTIRKQDHRDLVGELSLALPGVDPASGVHALLGHYDRVLDSTSCSAASHDDTTLFDALLTAPPMAAILADRVPESL